MLWVEKIHVYHGKIQALYGVTLTINEKELVAIIGANGAGKTTLLNSIIGIKPVQDGRIIFKGRDITKLPSWKRTGLGLVPEGGRIFPELSAEKNLFAGAYRRTNKVQVQESLEWVFSLFPVLRERRRQLAGTLSGGERQMLAIGRALMSDPVLLLVDEVSMGLMPTLVVKVFETIVRLREEKGITVLLAEQYAQEALKIVDRGYVLENGFVVLSGSAKELRENERVRKAYFGI